jgi:hypothetical protein
MRRHVPEPNMFRRLGRYLGNELHAIGVPEGCGEGVDSRNGVARLSHIFPFSILHSFSLRETQNPPKQAVEAKEPTITGLGRGFLDAAQNWLYIRHRFQPQGMSDVPSGRI